MNNNRICMNEKFKWFVVGAVCAFVISGSLIIFSKSEIQETKNIEIDYSSRFYKEALADFLQVQLYMFPFNSSDVVTLSYSTDTNYPMQTIFINHTVSNPEFYPIKELYNFTMNFGYEMTWQEGDN